MLKDENDKLNLAKYRIIGSREDEILFADDTILISESDRAISRLLHEIEKESEKYGMKLNKTKCEVLVFGEPKQIFFSDKTEVKHVIARIFEIDDKDKQLALIDQHERLWMKVVGTRGYVGKKTVNSSSQFHSLFEEV